MSDGKVDINKEASLSMKDRNEIVYKTRDYILSVSALLGIATLMKGEHFEPSFVIVAMVSFLIAILIAVTHVGYLYYSELYPNKGSNDNCLLEWFSSLCSIFLMTNKSTGNPSDEKNNHLERSSFRQILDAIKPCFVVRAEFSLAIFVILTAVGIIFLLMHVMLEILLSW